MMMRYDTATPVIVSLKGTCSITEAQVDSTEALYSDGGVKHDGSIWIRELAQGKEARRSSFDILRASRLQVQPKARCCAGEHDHEDAEGDTEL
jgi:hypothetical protein